MHLSESGAKPGVINATVTALRFFFNVIVGKPETTRLLAFVYEPREPPRVLPPDVLRMLEAAQPPKSKARRLRCRVTCDGGRDAQGASIDSQRMLIRVEQGKGRRDRSAILSAQLLELLRDWYRIARPHTSISYPAATSSRR